MTYTIMIGEEKGTKVKAFLIAPDGSRIHIGDTVASDKLTYRVVYVENFEPEDTQTWTSLRIALGAPTKITKVIREDVINWEVNDELPNVDG